LAVNMKNLSLFHFGNERGTGMQQNPASQAIPPFWSG
jgi:hypothetical protein